MREHRFAVLAWIVGGVLANYVMLLSLSQELADFPGGPEMLSKVLGPSIEAFRPLRWPADRLDTLGGYATYHNILLITMFLGVYAAVQGTNLVRAPEARGAMSMWLVVGVSRSRILMTRAITFALLLALIAAGIAGGTALALAVVEEPNTSGAFLTFLASWSVSVMCFSFGVLFSQFVSRPRLSSGIVATVVLALYVLGNSAETFGAFSFLQYLSPFTYSNLSRALVPGIEAHWPSMVGVLLVATSLLVLAAFLFGRRDIGDAVLHRRAKAVHRHARGSSATVRSLRDTLWHSQRSGVPTSRQVARR